MNTDNLTDKHALVTERLHQGGVNVSANDADFVQGAVTRHGEGERTKESAVVDFHHAMQWLRDEATYKNLVDSVATEQ